jgi:hypothetical protein
LVGLAVIFLNKRLLALSEKLLVELGRLETCTAPETINPIIGSIRLSIKTNLAHSFKKKILKFDPTSV